jgi:hypothetical protein
MRENVSRRITIAVLCATSLAMHVNAEDAPLVSIHALEQMNLKVHQMKSVPESVTEDYVTLVQKVANLHDPRAVPALLGAMETGDLAMQGLASMGDAALPSVMSATHDKEDVRVYAALQTLNLMLEPDNMKHFKNADVAKIEIQQTLMQLQNSQDPILAKNVKEILSKMDTESPVQVYPPDTPPAPH